ncbi:MAG: type II toxin-antitoxin system antitoxin SocA domain-containing protein [Balneolales bacterium]
MHSIKVLAAYILNKYPNEITPMKLQKLLYYVKVWTVVAGIKVLDPNHKFHAWKHGPVNPSIYQEYKSYKKYPIDKTPQYKSPNSEELEIIDFILDSYSFYNAITLSKATHAEDPWLNKKDYNGVITDADIIEYYSKESFAKNFPIGGGSGYYPPNTIAHYAYVFDMDKDDLASEIIFDSIDEYKDVFTQAKEQSDHFSNFY